MARARTIPVVLAAVLAAAFVLSTLPAEAFKVETDDIPTGLSQNVNLYAIGWKPSGAEALVVGDSKAVLVFRDSTGSFRKIEAPLAPDFLMGAAWKPDSTFALAVGSAGTALLFNGQTVTNVDTGTTRFLYDVEWAPDGSRALIVGAEGTILRYAGGVFSPVGSGTGKTLYKVSVNPTDHSALAVGVNSTLLRINPDGTVVKLPFVEDWTLHSVAWNPQGTLAVITGANGIVATFDGAAVKFINRDTPNVFLDVCWKPDGSQALISGDTGIVLKLREGRLTYIDAGIRSLLQGIAYRPGGSYALAVGNKAKCVRYPMKPAPKPASLLDNPLVLGGVIAVVAVAVVSVAYLDWREKRQLSSKKTARHLPRAVGKKRLR